MPLCIQREFCVGDFVPSCEKKVRGQPLLLYFYTFRIVQKMKRYGSLLTTTIRHPSQGTGYEIRRFGEKETYGFGIRGIVWKSMGNPGLEPLFLVCFDIAHSCLGDMVLSHETAKMLKKKTFSPQYLEDGHRFQTKFSVLYYWNWLSSFLLLC